MKINSVDLTGEHVKLIPMEESHIENLFEVAKYPEIWTYMSRKIKTINDMKNLVTEAVEARENGSELPLVIIDRMSDKIVGSTRILDISIANRSLEIGWTWLTPSVWRTLINTECKYLLMQHAFEVLDVIRVQIKADARNARSLQAIERLGAVKEGVLRRHRVLHDGYVRDSVYYSVIDSEWPIVKERLVALLQQ